MHICFNIAERLGSVYQPSCEKYELIFKHGTSLEAKFMLTREVVFMLQLQLSNLDRKGIIVKESLQSSSIGLFERAWDEAAASNNRAYVEVIDDKLDIVKSEELLSAEDCRKFMDELLYFTFGYVKNKKTNPRDLSASSIIGIRKITCGSPSYSLAMDVTAQKDSTQSVLLVELLVNDPVGLKDFLKIFCGVNAGKDTPDFIILVENGQFFKELRINAPAYPKLAETWDERASDRIQAEKTRQNEARLFTKLPISREVCAHLTGQALVHFQAICGLKAMPTELDALRLSSEQSTAVTLFSTSGTEQNQDDPAPGSCCIIA